MKESKRKSSKHKKEGKKSKRRDKRKNDLQMQQLDESQYKNKEEFEFDFKLRQVSNLLKELKSNSNSSGLTLVNPNLQTLTGTSTCPPYDEKSLKLQDLEKTEGNNANSELLEKIKAENSQLKKKVLILEKESDFQK